MSDERQGDLFFRPNLKGMVFAHPHETEVEAATRADRIKTKLQAEVLEAFRTYGEMTDEELENLPQFAHYGPTTVKKRRTELYQMGKLVWTGRKKPNSRGFNMKIWTLA